MLQMLMTAAALFAAPLGQEAQAVASAPEASATGSIPSTAAPAKAKKARRYCVDQVNTGALAPVRTCRTRAEWMERGWDPATK
jgi:hypothetical protein